MPTQRTELSLSLSSGVGSRERGWRLDHDVLLCPHRNGLDRRRKPAALHAERVLDANRRVGNDGPLDDALFLEFLKPLAQHPIRDVGDGVAQSGKPAAGAHQDVEDGAGPSPPDELAGVMKLPAELRRVRALISCHAIRIAPSLKFCNLLLYPVDTLAKALQF